MGSGHFPGSSQCGCTMLVGRMLTYRDCHRSSAIGKFLLLTDLLDRMRIGPQFRGDGFFPLRPGGARYGLLNQSGHQSIRAYFMILEGVWFAKKNLEQARHIAVVENQQNQQGFSSELTTDRRFNAVVSLGILNPKHLAAGLDIG